MLVHPVRLFILDDSPQITDILSELLSDPGNVEIVGTGDSAIDAIEEIRRSTPDVVIVDLQLKGGSGFDVVKAIRLLPQTSDIVVILFTNHASRELHQHALELGAVFFLDKSRDYAKILEILLEKVRAPGLIDANTWAILGILCCLCYVPFVFFRSMKFMGDTYAM